MEILPKALRNLIDELAKLPTIGPKTASRLAVYLITRSPAENNSLTQSIDGVSTGLLNCSECYTIASQSVCPVCASAKRNHASVLVVERPLDTVALERTGYQGIYFVLGGVISPIDGIGPEDLKIPHLLKKLSTGNTIKELILATNPSLEGEATALYLAREIDKLKSSGQIEKKLQITRLARGLPIGGDLEYADEETLTRALEGRREMD